VEWPSEKRQRGQQRRKQLVPGARQTVRGNRGRQCAGTHRRPRAGGYVRDAVAGRQCFLSFSYLFFLSFLFFSFRFVFIVLFPCFYYSSFFVSF
jgi:hypothetical protein